MLMNINDNYELILSSDDFKKMVDLYMGDEAAAYFGEIVASANEAVRAISDKTNSDSSSYEASLESNATAFTDIQEELANISEVLDSKRMSRDKIAHSVREISKIISNQI
jgi:hypothetical protein